MKQLFTVLTIASLITVAGCGEKPKEEAPATQEEMPMDQAAPAESTDDMD
jgi:predicted small lipoprotein YifL